MRRLWRTIAIWAAFGCARPSPASEPIWIGAVSTYRDADASEDNLRGIRLAVDQANRAGGVRGRRVELRILKDSGRGELAVRIARAFVEDERVVGVLGHQYSSAMIAAAPVYEGKLAAITTGTSSELSGISPWVFRIAQSDSALALAEARSFFARGWHRLAILHVNDVYGRGLVGTFVPAFRALGGEVVRRDPVTDTTTDFAVYVREYRRSRPDAVFIISGPNATDALFTEARAQRLNAHLVGADGREVTLSETYNSARRTADLAANRLDTASSRPESVSTTFKREFFRRFGYVPGSSAALSYDAALAMLEALRRGGPDRARVMQSLGSVTPLAQGATGPIGFQRGERVGLD